MTTRNMNRRGFLKVLGAGAVSLGLQACAGAPSRQVARKKPNFVFFLVDDMGWTDAVCFGSS
ncbi:MAG: twin-arginine translocation signal domain-containing protein, partial [Planctomycetota bacterium]